MAGKGLVIGIDYTDRYCQACYYSARHSRPESVSAGSDIRRYLIPSVLCYDPESSEWVVGDSAMRISEKPGVLVFSNLMRNVRAGTTAMAGGREYTYIELLAIYFGKLLEFIQIMTSVMAIENITVTMRNVSSDTRDSWEQIFDILKIPENKVRLLSSPESFGYFIINEKPEMWQEGAILFDFSLDGFYVEQLYIADRGLGPVIFINEYDFSSDFQMSNLASEVLRDQLDRKLTSLYLDLVADGGNYSVFFTGEGFNDQWFNTTLNSISDSRRAFKGSNIYVKGATLAGQMRYEDKPDAVPMLCPGRTRSEITLSAWDNGRQEEILLSPAAVDWYDAGYEGDFILENEHSIVFSVTSIVDGKKSPVELELRGFGNRPSKATRVTVTVRYRRENECVITVTDKGFGDFFIDGGATASITINPDSMD